MKKSMKIIKICWNFMFSREFFSKIIEVQFHSDGADQTRHADYGRFALKFKPVQERDIITFVTNFSCCRAWKRDFLIKNGSRWTRNWKNESSSKINIFFIFCLYINEKWENHDFLACPILFVLNWSFHFCHQISVFAIMPYYGKVGGKIEIPIGETLGPRKG